jgi:putative toxin-antitoxin system antitoxin component (TIGR02293 family)
MTTEKSQMTKGAKRETARGRAMQKKNIQHLLQGAEDYDYLHIMKETLKGQVVFRSKDIKMVGKLKHRSERKNSIHVILLNRIKEGIDASAFEKVTNALGIPMKEGYTIMGIPQSTLRRRLDKGKLLPDESGRVYRYAELLTKATEMMQKDEDRAANWLKKPMDIFAGETPLQHAMTEVGSRDVEDLIGRIRHGVFS